MMNYEEKYNADLERAETLIEKLESVHIKGFIYHIFPELIEDKSEKIRKELIDYINRLTASPNNIDKYNTWIAWLEKQGEQTTDKIESKFKVGDWVILNGIVAKILDKQKYGFVGLDIDGKDFFCNYGHTDSMRLWSINDANDGDVLATSAGAFIYNSKNGGDSRPGYYCGINTLGKFQISSGNKWTNKEVYPATKEQRDLLFQKIKEAGYKWDAYKKELKKIEHKMLDADKVIEWLKTKIYVGSTYGVKMIEQFKKDFEI